MKKPVLVAAMMCAAVGGIIAADVAIAHGNVTCEVPRKERKPMVELQRMLKKAGWFIKKMQVYQGCYEVYGFDDKNEPIEAIFDPRTLDRITTV